jgi:pSer/pThr/pTyr-binding forkhead associated (FHA) protein
VAKNSSKDFDSIFARAVLKAGYADEASIKACGSRLRADKSDPPSVRLPDVLLDEGVLTNAQLAEVLGILRVRLATCSDCGFRRYVRPDRDPWKPCKKCRRSSRTEKELLEKGEAPEADLRDPDLPTEIAHLRILRRLIGGGEIGVYKAFNSSLDRIVSVTLLSPRFAEQSPLETKALVNGARDTARIDHPNLVHVFHVGEENGWSFIETEFVEGLSLERLLGMRSPLPVEEATAIMRQVAEAIQAMHSGGLTHGRIHPTMIRVRRDRVSKLSGFGLSTAFGRSQSISESAAMEYMAYRAPEVLQEEPADARADLYSLGVAFFRCVAGRLPFLADDRADLVRKQCWDRPPDPCDLNSRLPRVVGDLILRLLAKKPGGRFADAGEFLAALANATAREGGARLARLELGSVASLHPVTSSDLIIGRGAECGVVLRDDRASRKHTKVALRTTDVGLEDHSAVQSLAGVGTLSLQGCEVVVADLRSSNGTYINARQISRRVLVPGDIVRVGRTHFVYLISGMPLKRDLADARGRLVGQISGGGEADLLVTDVPILIGSCEEADLRLKGQPDMAAQIVATNEGVQITHLVEETPATEFLSDGDVIHFGRTALTFQASIPEARATGVGAAIRPPDANDGFFDITGILADEADRVEQLDTPPPATSADAFGPAEEDGGDEAEPAWAPSKAPSTAPNPGMRTPTSRPDPATVGAQNMVLTAKAGPRKGDSFPIGREETMIGSNEECGISLPESLVSGRHARILRKEGVAVLEDLQSKNGVYVNGTKIRIRPIKPGDEIRIGTTKFLVHL